MGNNFEYLIEEIREEIAVSLGKIFKFSKSEIKELIKIELPPQHISADIFFSAFDIAKKLKENPEIIAKTIAKTITEESRLVTKATAVGPFINLETNQKILYAKILSDISLLKEKYGESNVYAGKTALIEYSSPNIAKPIGVGHLRSTIIGQALANLYGCTGYAIIKGNHLGDWGTQIGELIYAYRKWGDEKKIKENPVIELKNLYVKFHQEVEKTPEIKEKARRIFKLLESGDHGLITLWKYFRELSIEDFKKTYDRLGIVFDTYIGESYFIDKTDEVVEECLKQGLARKETDTEAVIVDSLNGLPSFLLRKQDGTALYLTRDLATLKFRIKTFKPDIILYVVGKEQELHFQQLFTLSKKMGVLDSQKTTVRHIDFGLVLSEGEKMSTRKGTVIELEDVMNQAVTKSKEILVQKNIRLSREEIDEISEIIGIGAIIYNDLRQSRVKNITFNWKKMLNFEGESSIYLQYTYARINSILNKVTEPSTKGDNSNILFEKKQEFELAKKLMFFPLIIIRAQQLDSPHLICGYLEELAQIFNNFYHETSIIGTEDSNLRNSRIILIKSIAQVIKNGLFLLNIQIPPKM